MLRRLRCWTRHGLNRFPGDEYLLSAEAKISDLLGNDARGLQALNKAFSGSGNASPYVALRLAKQHMRSSRKDDARAILRTSFEGNPLNKAVAFELGKLILGPSLAGADEARYYLRKAFVVGDTNYEAQFYFAAAACVAGSWMKQNRFSNYYEARLCTILLSDESDFERILNILVPLRFYLAMAFLYEMIEQALRPMYQKANFQ